MRVKVERNDHLNAAITYVVRAHAGAGTRENCEEFQLTPAQASLVWWGMELLERAVRDAARWADLHDEYADTLRCHADAIEWSRAFKRDLLGHVKSHKMEVAPCR